MFSTQIAQIKKALEDYGGTVEVIRCCAERYSPEEMKIFTGELKESGITGGRLQRIRKRISDEKN